MVVVVDVDDMNEHAMVKKQKVGRGAAAKRQQQRVDYTHTIFADDSLCVDRTFDWIGQRLP